ncbi:hypothetical protein D3C76_1795950 [compost metagenome]
MTYAYKVTGLPAWAGSKEVTTTIRQLGEAVATNDTPARETREMVLTDKGWVHERLFDR